jgi:hypothetical protein
MDDPKPAGNAARDDRRVAAVRFCCLDWLALEQAPEDPPWIVTPADMIRPVASRSNSEHCEFELRHGGDQLVRVAADLAQERVPELFDEWRRALSEEEHAHGILQQVTLPQQRRGETAVSLQREDCPPGDDVPDQRQIGRLGHGPDVWMVVVGWPVATSEKVAKLSLQGRELHRNQLTN